MKWVHRTVLPPTPNAPSPGSTAEDLYNDAGVLVMRLWPEWTRDGNKSVGWAWKLPDRYAIEGPRYGINWGESMDKETARQCGLQVARTLSLIEPVE